MTIGAVLKIFWPRAIARRAASTLSCSRSRAHLAGCTSNVSWRESTSRGATPRSSANPPATAHVEKNREEDAELKKRSLQHGLRPLEGYGHCRTQNRGRAFPIPEEGIYLEEHGQVVRVPRLRSLCVEPLEGRVDSLDSFGGPLVSARPPDENAGPISVVGKSVSLAECNNRPRARAPGLYRGASGEEEQRMRARASGCICDPAAARPRLPIRHDTRQPPRRRAARGRVRTRRARRRRGPS